MDYENDDKDDSKRKSRNLSEKKRRDQFNMLVNELSAMVSANSRKMDKSMVLKSTIAFLKNHNEVSSRSKVHEIQSNWKPPFLSNEEFTHLILEALDGFIMVFSSSGRIYYASEGITSLLGYIPTDLLNISIYELVYKDDQGTLYNVLLNPNAIVESTQRGTINPEHQTSFSCFIKRGDLNAQESYEPVQFVGYFRSESDIDTISGARYAAAGYNTENRVVFVGTGRLQTPQLIREMSIASTKSEFTSRHSLEWKFLFLDHRAPPIIGYLPFEVLGTSGYDYYHFDDLDKVVLCHEALMQKGEGTSCFYRFLTKGQQWIWLQTRFYVTYHQWNSKPEFVVCTHRVVSYADAIKNHHNSDEKENDAKNVSTTSVTTTSPWSKSSRAPKYPSNSSSPKPRHSRRYAGSDSASISGDSPSSCHYSVMSHMSTKSKSRNSTQPLRQTNQTCMQQMSTQPAAYYPGISSQMVPHHSRQPGPTQMMAPTFMESPQYVAAIPVQPAIIATSAFAGQAVIQPSLDYLPSNVVLTPAQNQIQDQLQRKHEELQHLIQQQQEELRRVSEQLMMARYGIVSGMPSFSSTTSNSPCEAHYQPQNQQPPQMDDPSRMHQMSQVSDPGGGEHSDYNIQMDQIGLNAVHEPAGSSARSEHSDMMPFQILDNYNSSGTNKPSTSQ